MLVIPLKACIPSFNANNLFALRFQLIIRRKRKYLHQKMKINCIKNLTVAWHTV